MTDWMQVREKYVSGRMSLQELAESEGLKYIQVRKRASAEDWTGQREAFRERVAEQARKTAIRRRGKREAEVLQQVEDAAEELVARITAALEDDKLLYRHLVMAHGSTEERVYNVLNAKNGRELVGMMTELAALIAGHGNILDKRTKDEISLKKQRLKLDREKAGLDGGGDGETGIGLMPPVEEQEGERVELPEV